MFRLIEQILREFRPCFSRETAFGWFVVVIIGMITRQDHLGVTSIIRELSLNSGWYECLIHFFHSPAWSADKLRAVWYRYLSKYAPLYRVNGRIVLAGDGVKQSKEGYRMPGVKKMKQESEDSSKGEYIFGHLFGAVGVLIGQGEKKFCLPLKINIQDGLHAAARWKGSGLSAENHIQQMIQNGMEAVKTLGKGILLLDRYFLSAPGLKLLNSLNGDQKLLDIVTKAKKNCTAYYPAPPREKGKRGRPQKKGDSIKLATLFSSGTVAFTKGQAFMYGEKQEVEYYCVNLLWGPKLYMMLRFVLVKWNGMNSILVTTDLEMDPITVIELYAQRAKIENMFREMKQQLGGFGYHFWTLAQPKLNHFAKKEAPDPLSKVKRRKDRKRILGCIQATEKFVTCATVAMGIVQLISVHEYSSNSMLKLRYLRTPSRQNPSEGTVMYYFRKNLFSMLLSHPDSFITRFIRERQRDSSGKKLNDVA